MRLFTDKDFEKLSPEERRKTAENYANQFGKGCAPYFNDNGADPTNAQTAADIRGSEHSKTASFYRVPGALRS